MMKLGIIVASLCLLDVAIAADLPVVYDHKTKEDATKEGASIDQAVNAALAAEYSIRVVEDSPAYTNPKAVRGSLPHSAKSDTGEALAGYVLVAYVVAADGTAADPAVLKSTDERLNKVALQSIADWRFEPAKLNGVSIATTAAQEFYFKADSAPPGFQVTNVVLYQTDDVLKARVAAVEQLADYIKKLEAVSTDFFAADTKPETLHIVMAIKPGKKVRVWFVSSIRSDNDSGFSDLRQKLEAVDPIVVSGGPVAFAISSIIAGGEGKNPVADKNFQPPIPTAWIDAAKNLKSSVAVPDGFLEAVWPDN